MLDAEEYIAKVEAEITRLKEAGKHKHFLFSVELDNSGMDRFKKYFTEKHCTVEAKKCGCAQGYFDVILIF